MDTWRVSLVLAPHSRSKSTPDTTGSDRNFQHQRTNYSPQELRLDSSSGGRSVVHVVKRSDEVSRGLTCRKVEVLILYRYSRIIHDEV
jgi:hypothetical protein